MTDMIDLLVGVHAQAKENNLAPHVIASKVSVLALIVIINRI